MRKAKTRPARSSQRGILKALAQGALIRVDHSPTAIHPVHRLSSTGQLIQPETIARMLNERLIRPNSDGLFGSDGPVQSYRLFRASEGGA